MLQGKHKQLLLAQILPCVGFHRIDERHIPRADESVVSCGKEQIVHGIVLQLAYKPLVETAAAHTPEPRERGLCGDCDGCDVPDFDEVVVGAGEGEALRGVDCQTVDRGIGMPGECDERLDLRAGSDQYAVFRQ